MVVSDVTGIRVNSEEHIHSNRNLKFVLIWIYFLHY
jgi:hypothetical protein